MPNLPLHTWWKVRVGGSEGGRVGGLVCGEGVSILYVDC